MNYFGAYIYVCKSDRDVLHSDSRPDLNNVVQYSTANASNRRERNEKKEKKKLTNLNVMMIIRSKGIKDETVLLALADENYDKGHTAPMEYLANTPERKYKALIAKVWKIAASRGEVQRQQTSRMEQIWVAVTLWMEMGQEVLTKNHINANVFAARFCLCFCCVQSPPKRM